VSPFWFFGTEYESGGRRFREMFEAACDRWEQLQTCGRLGTEIIYISRKWHRMHMILSLLLRKKQCQQQESFQPHCPRHLFQRKKNRIFWALDVQSHCSSKLKSTPTSDSESNTRSQKGTSNTKSKNVTKCISSGHSTLDTA